MGKHYYIHDDNAEDVLNECLTYIKSNEAKQARSEAFADCTEYWAGEIKKILNYDSSDAAKLDKIRRLLSIEG